MRDSRFAAVVVIVFATSAAATVVLCRSMSGGMPMAGGWTMSMAWMRMPGQSWLGAAGMFLVMWLAMMIAMMMPAEAVTLSKYRVALRIRGWTRIDRLTASAAAGYFLVWLAIGAVIYPIGASLAMAAMRWTAAARALPVAGAATIVLGGVLQLTRWKARQLRGCRDTSDCCVNPATTPGAAWVQGLRSGLRCSACCAGFTATLLVAGVMSLGAMAAVAAAITIERIAPRGLHPARIIGGALVLIGIGAGAAGL